MSGGLLKKLWSLILLGALASVLLGGSQVMAQTFTLTHNGWTYSEDISGQGRGDFKDTNGTNHMFRNWWWYRTNLDSAEKPLSNLVTKMSGGANNVQLVFREDAGNPANALLIKLDYTLTGVSANTAYVNIAWSVQYIYGQQPITVDFFAYSDFDLNGGDSGDSGVLVNPQTVRYIDGTTAVDVVASKAGLEGYEVGTPSHLLGKLNNTVTDNVSNTGLPYGPGDMANIFQWHGTVVSGPQVMQGTLTKLINLNYTPPPGPVIPEPGTWALMLSGLAPVALRLRKKA
jgi:hypothetical protein